MRSSYRVALVAGFGTAGLSLAWAQSIDSKYTFDSGCTEDGATGWYFVYKNGVKQMVLVVDQNESNTAGGDGIPEQVWCLGDTSATTLSSTGTNTCGGLDTLSGGSCAFAIDIWRGTSGDNSADCSSNTDPVMMFGGEGDDTLLGSEYGDLLHGGAGVDYLNGDEGRDYICSGEGDLSTGDTGDAQTLVGGDGDDLLWGGPHIDWCIPGAGADLATGGPDNDRILEAADDSGDSLHGDAGSDEMECGPGDDVAHAGKGDDNVTCDDGADVLLMQDLAADSVASGQAGTDTCYIDDAAGTSKDDSSADCDSEIAVVPCSLSMFVGTHEIGGDTGAPTSTAILYELDVYGQRVERAPLRNAGGNHPEEVVGLAINPLDCLLYVVVQDGTDQYLTTIDTSTEPSGGATTDYDMTFVGNIPGDDMVDIAFNSRGSLGGLETDADLVVISKTNATESGRTAIGRSGASGMRLAYDAPDGGVLFIVTEFTSGEFDVDAYDFKSGLIRSVEHDIDWFDGLNPPHPFAIAHPGVAGTILEIDDELNKAYGYAIYTRGRRNWSGVLSSGSMTDGRAEYYIGGASSPCPSSPQQCFADIDEPPDAFTVPHFAE